MSPRSEPNRKKRPPSWSTLWFKSTNSLKHVVVSMHLPTKPNPNPKPPPPATATKPAFFPHLPDKEKVLFFDQPPCVDSADRTLQLPDQILHRIFSNLSSSDSHSLYLVCKRWLHLQGRLVRSLKVLDSRFLESGRLSLRFPNLVHIDLINACVSDSLVLLSRGALCLRLDSTYIPDQDQDPTFLPDDKFISENVVDKGLIALANGYPNLRKLTTFAGTEFGLMSIATQCPYLQQLELHKCNDEALRAIVGCKNLQILKLVGSVDGVYHSESSISDIGLTILAQGCKRLVKLELSGCEGSFDGIKAIAQCCQMLEELSLCDHRMEDGWLAAVSHFENLRSLRLISCKKIDLRPGPDEYLGSCPTLECLHLHKCQLRDTESLRALFVVCKASLKDITIQDCWGLDDEIFSTARVCRGVKSLSLEGASLLTTKGIESVLLSWVELERLRVVSCTRIKENEVSSQLSAVFALLQVFKWMLDTKSHLSSYMGTASGKRGSKFFRKSQVLKSL
ncbi:hypothetical protein QQ045_006889 [Rhodiola kirilowii]